jgi:hypothetical protein
MKGHTTFTTAISGPGVPEGRRPGGPRSTLQLYKHPFLNGAASATNRKLMLEPRPPPPPQRSCSLSALRFPFVICSVSMLIETAIVHFFRSVAHVCMVPVAKSTGPIVEKFGFS